ADGKLTLDAALHLWLNRIEKQITGTATVHAADTANTTAIQDMLAQVQRALENGSYVDQHGNPYTAFADDPATPGIDADMRVKLYDGKLLFTSSYQFKILADSTNAGDLGLSFASGDLTSSVPYAIDAPAAGATVSIGVP